MNGEAIRLSLELKSVPVVLEGGPEGEEKECELRELTGADRNKYLNKLTSRVKIGKDGQAVGIKSFEGFQADLLSKCLYGPQEELFTVEDIEALPSSTQEALFKKAQELNSLDAGNPSDEKND